MLTEGVAASIRYKFYASGAMAANAEPDITAEPGAAGGKLLRRVAATLNLKKDTTRSQEILPSRQVRTFRHAARWTEGGISGELSPGTYADFFEAIHRDTAQAFADKSETQYASVAASASASTFTLGGGDPVADGLRVGDLIRFSGLTATANNGRNFIVLGFSGANNRTIEVFPAPAEMATPDTAFGLTVPGKRSMVPASGHLRRKLAAEIYREDIDRSRLFTELRAHGYRVTTSATGIVGVSFDFTGRNMHRLKDGAAPYFAAPDPITDTDGCDAINGIVRLNGVRVGVVTGNNFGVAASVDAPKVQQKFPPDVLVGTANGTGELSVLIDDSDFGEVFDKETEFEVLCWLTSSTAPDAPSVAFHMPRCKATDAPETVAGEGSQALSIPYQMMEYLGSAPGVSRTTIRMHDTAWA